MAQVISTETYRRLVCEVVEQHARLAAGTPQPETIAVCDTAHDNYLLVDVGWEKDERSHYVVVHLRLREGKVWIEKDGIEYGIAYDLLDAGIPAEDIIMAAYSPRPSPLVEPAAA